MNGNKLTALGWWTFANLIAAATLFTFPAMGPCFQGVEGAVCRAQSSAFTKWLPISEVLAYTFSLNRFYFRCRSWQLFT